MEDSGYTRHFRSFTLGLLLISLVIIGSIAYTEHDNDAYPGAEYGEENGFQYTIYAGEVSIARVDDTLLDNPIIPSTIKGFPVTEIHRIQNVTGSLIIPDSVKTIGQEAFDGCSGLTGNLIIPDSVEYLGGSAFKGCSGLTGNLIIPGSIKEIGSGAFQGCSGFNTLVIENGVERIGYGSFEGCTGLSGDLIIPSSVVGIGDGAFIELCFEGQLLLSEKIRTIGAGAFKGCSGFTGELVLPSSLKYIYSSAFQGCTGFVGDLIIPEGVTSIGASAFQGCTGFVGDLIIPEGVTYIGMSAFEGCTGFTGRLVIPNSVDEIHYHAFAGCYGINFLCFSSNKLPKIMGEDCFALGIRGYRVNLTVLGLVNQTISSFFCSWTTLSYGNGTEHTVRFDLDGGSDYVSPINVAKRDVFSIPSYYGTKDGYKFVGWIYDGTIYKPKAEVEMGDSDMLLKAVWEPVGDPSNSSDGTGSNDSPLTSTLVVSLILGIVAILFVFVYIIKHKSK